MQLVPKLPPGRRDRKIAAYGDEIRRLHAAGYTFRTIQATLADAGVRVHVTTVQREACRTARSSQTVGASSAPSASPAAVSAISGLVPGKVSARDFASAFMQEHIGNPLLRARLVREESS